MAAFRVPHRSARRSAAPATPQATASKGKSPSETRAVEATQPAPHKSSKTPSVSAIEVVASRLGSLVLTVEAIHNVAWCAADWNPKEREAALALIWESARGVARALDACQQRLGGSAIGVFADDLEDAP